MNTRRTSRKAVSVEHAMTSAEAMIDMHGIVKTFKSAAGEFTVLKGIDLTINRGEFVSIVGKSGSGKSTLLNMITGIDHPTSGQMIIGGTDIYTNVTESQRSKWRGRNLGIVFQFFQLMPMLTLLENVMLPMDYAELYDFDERPERAMEMLKLVGLEEFANKLPILVSTGQQQLAAIARAVACDPPLLVADEPTGNLDTKSANTIIDLFEKLSQSGKTVVMVTHDSSLTSRTTRNIIIADGELINETVAKSLPWLRHRHMMEFSKIAETQIYPAKASIISRDEHVENFFMIHTGEVEIVLQDGKKNETVVSRLGSGEFFGEIELLRGGKSIANVRASADGPVELLTIKREDFKRVMDQSPITVEAVGKIVQERLDAHRAADSRTVRPFSLFRRKK
ncbi:MAG TPA: ATP-binding cassette domain-containing protein [Anaerolineales bacterium]|nr:ATP-binding cassette domain-containing protein [Anaerolineales bacterium]